MGGHKSDGCSWTEPPALPTPNYHVAGTLIPDITGNYFYTGIHDGKSYYRKIDETYFLWWRAAEGLWYLSKIVGFWPDEFWYRDDPDILGDYDPDGGAIGIATVIAGPA